MRLTLFIVALHSDRMSTGSRGNNIMPSTTEQELRNQTQNEVFDERLSHSVKAHALITTHAVSEGVVTPNIGERRKKRGSVLG